MSPGDGARVAVGDVHQRRARRTASATQPTTCRPAGTVALRVAQVAPADEDQHQRHEPADLADRAVDDGADDVARPRRAAATRRRRRPRRRARAGTARRRRAGARARGRGRCGRSCGRWRPTTWATPSQTATRPRPRASPSAAIGPVPFRTARGAGRLEGFVERAARRAWTGPAAGRPGRGGRGPSSRPWGPPWRRSCSATPAGKTYGSPWSGIYTAVTPVTRITRRIIGGEVSRRWAPAVAGARSPAGSVRVMSHPHLN